MKIYRIQDTQSNLFHCGGSKLSKNGKVFTSIQAVKLHLRLLIVNKYRQLITKLDVDKLVLYEYNLDTGTHTMYKIAIEKDKILLTT